MQEPWTRRQALAAAGSAFSFGLAGCSKNPGNDPSPTPMSSPTASGSGPVGEGAAAAAPSCPDGYQPLTPQWIVQGPGPLGGFELTLDMDTYENGDELVAELRNVTNEEQMTGVKKMFDIQYEGDAGWHTIFGLPDDQDPVWPRVGFGHQPGEGFTWRLTLSQAGLSEGEIDSAPSFHACQAIKPGQYRFVYWGITTEQEREEDSGTEFALGVPFTVNDI